MESVQSEEPAQSQSIESVLSVESMKSIRPLKIRTLHKKSSQSSIKKNHALSLEEKIKIIEMKEKNIPVKTICEIYKCGKTQVYNACKERFKLREEWLKGDVTRKRKRSVGYDDIDKLTWEWFQNAKSRNISVTGVMLREKAKEIAEELNKTDFKASNGWLISFKNRHGIQPKQILEADDQSDEKLKQWRKKLPVLIWGYKPQDLYNCGESGLFFRALPSRTLLEKDEACMEGKYAKERLTVFLCCNMDGDMEKPLVISSVQTSKCFKNIDISSLPVTWEFEKRSWTTSYIFKEWLNGFNTRLKKENRNILLFLDGEIYPTKIELSNIKLQYFPCDRIDETQPLDQGIIFSVKMHYRMLFLQSLLSTANADASLSELAENVGIFDVMKWVGKACEKVSRETITKCFIFTGFPFDKSVEDETASASFNEFDALFYDASYLLGCTEISSIEYIKSDDNVFTNECMEMDEDMVQDNSNSPDQGDSSNGCNDSEDEEESNNPISSYAQAIETIKHLQTFFMKEGSSDLLSLSTDLQIATEKNIVLQRRFKQMSILGFCNPVNVSVKV